MAVWRPITHHGDPERLLKWSLQTNRIALGWSNVGDLSKFMSQVEVSAEAVRVYPQLRNRFQAGFQLWAFANELKAGDLVILSACGARQAVVEVVGNYQFDATLSDPDWYSHTRSVMPSNWDANELWKESGGGLVGQSIYRAFIRCQVDPRSK